MTALACILSFLAGMAFGRFWYGWMDGADRPAVTPWGESTADA